MHIKPAPPARRTSHPAFLVLGILINRADRKSHSGPPRRTIQLLSSNSLSCMLMLRCAATSGSSLEKEAGLDGGERRRGR